MRCSLHESVDKLMKTAIMHNISTSTSPKGVDSNVSLQDEEISVRDLLDALAADLLSVDPLAVDLLPVYPLVVDLLTVHPLTVHPLAVDSLAADPFTCS